MSYEIADKGVNWISFPKLGFEFDVDPTAFTVFGIEIQWYGLLITIGMMLAIIYCFSQMKSYGIDSDRAIDAVLGGIIGGVIGARAYYVILEWDRYADDIGKIFSIREGGLAIYGGIIGALLVGGTVAKLRKVRLLPLLDLVGQGFLIGQCIGRWGNFFNQEAFGCNTDSVFGMTGGKIQSWISNAYLSSECYSNLGVEMDPSVPVHPCFLYESVWCFIGFIILAVVSRKFRKFDGQIFLMYIAWYGLGRSFIEGLRTDSLVIGSIRVSQALAVICVVAAVLLLIIIGSKVKRMGVDYKLYVDTEESKAMLLEAEKQRTMRKEKKSGAENTSDPENADTDFSENDPEEESLTPETEETENDGSCNEADETENDESAWDETEKTDDSTETADADNNEEE